MTQPTDDNALSGLSGLSDFVANIPTPPATPAATGKTGLGIGKQPHHLHALAVKAAEMRAKEGIPAPRSRANSEASADASEDGEEVKESDDEEEDGKKSVRFAPMTPPPSHGRVQPDPLPGAPKKKQKKHSRIAGGFGKPTSGRPESDNDSDDDDYVEPVSLKKKAKAMTPPRSAMKKTKKRARSSSSSSAEEGEENAEEEENEEEEEGEEEDDGRSVASAATARTAGGGRMRYRVNVATINAGIKHIRKNFASCKRTILPASALTRFTKSENFWPGIPDLYPPKSAIKDVPVHVIKYVSDKGDDLFFGFMPHPCFFFEGNEGFTDIDLVDQENLIFVLHPTKSDKVAGGYTRSLFINDFNHHISRCTDCARHISKENFAHVLRQPFESVLKSNGWIDAQKLYFAFVPHPSMRGVFKFEKLFGDKDAIKEMSDNLGHKISFKDVQKKRGHFVRANSPFTSAGQSTLIAKLMEHCESATAATFNEKGLPTRGPGAPPPAPAKEAEGEEEGEGEGEEENEE